MMSPGSLHYRNGCGFPERGNGQKQFLLVPVPGIAGEHLVTIGEKMQGIARDFLGVTREAGRADDQQATFHNRKNSTVEHSVRVLVPWKDVVVSDWRPARKCRQRLHPAVTFRRSRANPAPCIPGGAA
jgi:hypothetical protein